MSQQFNPNAMMNPILQAAGGQGVVNPLGMQPGVPMGQGGAGGDYLIAKVDTKHEFIPQTMDPRHVSTTLLQASQFKPEDFSWKKMYLPGDGKVFIVNMSTIDRLPDDGYSWISPENKTKLPLHANLHLVICETLMGCKPGEKQPTMSKFRYYFETMEPRTTQIQLIHYLPLSTVSRDKQMNQAQFAAQRMGSLPQHPAHHTQLPIKPSMPQMPHHPMNYPPPNAAHKFQKKPKIKGVHDPRLPGAGHVQPGAPVDHKAHYPGGDELDLVTAKEVSLFRYMRNHNWMEDIFSPVSVSKLTAPEPHFTENKVESLNKLLQSAIQTNQELKENQKNDAYSKLIADRSELFGQLANIDNIQDLSEFSQKELANIRPANEDGKLEVKPKLLTEITEPTPFNTAVQSPSLQFLKI